MNSPWISVAENFPPDGDIVDIWFNVWASPLSFGLADQWCESGAWREAGKWFHHCAQENNKKLELQSRYITHWKPSGPTDIEAPDALIWKAAGLANIPQDGKES